MKKIYLPIILGIIIILLCMVYPRENKNTLKKIKVSEVAHSIFYAPMYVASGLGYFNEEGLDVEFILGNGADKVTASLLSGDVEIGFCGMESSIYAYKEGEKDYLINFASLTKKDGSFIISRNNEEFNIKDLINKHYIAGRSGGMPSMTLEWILNENDISKDDLNFDTSISFSSMAGAFIGGIGDYVSLFEPTASEVVDNGYGYIVSSLGDLGGVIPYTTFMAKKSYIENNKDIIESFKRAIDKGLKFVYENDSKDIANAIKDYFVDTDIDKLIKIIDRYKSIDSWYYDSNLIEKDFYHAEDIIINSGFLDKKIDFSILTY